MTDREATRRGPYWTQTEGDAERLLLALETQIIAADCDSGTAERHSTRIRFALARVAELRESADPAGGVFEPARLEVALSILGSTMRQAELFGRRAEEREIQRWRAA